MTTFSIPVPEIGEEAAMKTVKHILEEGGRMLFISGQGPREYDVDVESQIRQTFEVVQDDAAVVGDHDILVRET